MVHIDNEDVDVVSEMGELRVAFNEIISAKSQCQQLSYSPGQRTEEEAAPCAGMHSTHRHSEETSSSSLDSPFILSPPLLSLFVVGCLCHLKGYKHHLPSVHAPSYGHLSMMGIVEALQELLV